MQPRNYLTSFIDTVYDGRLNLSAHDQQLFNSLKHSLASAECFLLPPEGLLFPDDVGLREIDMSVEGFTRPPYPVTVLEFDLTDEAGDIVQCIVIAMEDTARDGTLLVPTSRGLEHNWKIPALGWFFPNKAGSAIFNGDKWAHNIQHVFTLPDEAQKMANAAMLSVDDFMIGIYETTTAYLIRAYLHLCAALGMYSTDITDIPLHKGRNKIRRAQGKLPLFTYKVLTVGKKKRKSHQLGGTHASPRSHLRRGYYRTSRNGNRHWVQPCMVKGETPGFVHKDYRVEGEKSYEPDLRP